METNVVTYIIYFRNYARLDRYMFTAMDRDYKCTWEYRPDIDYYVLYIQNTSAVNHRTIEHWTEEFGADYYERRYLDGSVKRFEV